MATRKVLIQVFTVEKDIFVTALKKWFKVPLEDSVCESIVCRLDEYNIGGINITVLDEFAGFKSLRVQIASYRQVGAPRPSGPKDSVTSERQSPEKTSGTIYHPPGEKLLVWVDDNPGNNIRLVEFARSIGIRVYELPSTAVAKVWIDQNIGGRRDKECLTNTLDLLRSNNSGTSIRIITDNARRESSTEGVAAFFNHNAGEEVLRFVRGRGLESIPVLVFCARTNYTTYVRNFALAGSTGHPRVVHNYITALKTGVDDMNWARFEAK